MSEWKETKLGDLIKIKSGFSYKGEFIGKGDSFLLGMGCVSFNKRFLNSGARKYSGTFSDSFTAKPGDIVLATRQQSDNLPILGLPAILPIEFKDKKVVVGTNLYRVENHSEISNDFLFWLLKSPEYQRHILASAKGTTVKMITKDAVESFRFNCPPIEVRDFISQTLSDIEDKIELNNKINQELESLAQLLFKRWFVDFEFPNEKGEPYKSSGGEIVDSELGEIPKGWNILSLESATTEITRGFTTSYVEKSNLINLNQKVNRGSFLDKSNFKYYSDETIVPNNKYAKKQDILINSLGQGTLGRIHFYLEDTNNVIVDQHITIVRANNFKVLPEILYLILTLDTNIERMSNMVTGSTGMLMLNISKIREFKVIAPPIKIQSEIAKVLYSLYEKINLNLQENEGLSKMRDCLIPKLITGELKINDN